jgi:hypothetical protein
MESQGILPETSNFYCLPGRAGGTPNGFGATSPKKPRGGYGQHHYHFAEHGLDEPAEREKLRPYMLHSGTITDPQSAPMGSPPRTA